MSIKTKSLILRFVKGFVSGAITSMIMVTAAAPSNWTELSSIGTILTVSGIFGGLNGLLLSIEKYLGWKENLIA